MAQCTVMDLFPAFISFWDEAKTESPERQVELWLTDYLPGWSELLAKEQENYADQGADWRNVAKYRIFSVS